MNKDIHNQNTVHNISTLMSAYGIRAASVGHLVKFLDDIEAMVKENEKDAYTKGFNHGLDAQLNIEE
tara:strand:+ start:7448 stop:7648 length:201 start_codon:yes stop_codon:yes gene_type:complete